MRPSSLCAAHRTPVELWSQMLDILPFHDLVSATQVCRRWREVVCDLPGFWGNVRLDSLSVHSLYWATRRVHAARDRIFALTIDIKTPVCDSEEGAQLFRILSHALAHVGMMDVTLALEDAERLWDALRAPAPRLSRFSLYLFRPVDGLAHILPALDADIFSGSAPNLTRLTLRDVTVPPTTVPALLGVVSASFMLLYDAWMHSWDKRLPYRTWQAFPQHIFPVLPGLEALYLAIGGLHYSTALPPSVVRGFMNLKVLRVDTGIPTDNIHFFMLMPTARIPDLKIVRAADHSMRLTAAHFAPGTGTCLSIRRSTIVHAPFVDMCIMSPSGNKRRTYIHPLPAAPNTPLLLPKGLQDAWATQFRVVSVATSLWAALGRLLPPLPNLCLLEFFIDDGRLPTDRRMSRDRMTGVRCVCLRAERTLVLDALSVVAFMIRLAVQRHRVELRLVNVQVKGDKETTDILSRLYRIV